MMIDSGSDVTTLSEEAWLDVLKEAEATERPPKSVKWGDGFRILKGYAIAHRGHVHSPDRNTGDGKGCRDQNLRD
jgi:hypothetical protein